MLDRRYTNQAFSVIRVFLLDAGLCEQLVSWFQASDYACSTPVLFSDDRFLNTVSTPSTYSGIIGKFYGNNARVGVIEMRSSQVD